MECKSCKEGFFSLPEARNETQCLKKKQCTTKDSILKGIEEVGSGYKLTISNPVHDRCIHDDSLNTTREVPNKYTLCAKDMFYDENKKECASCGLGQVEDRELELVDNYAVELDTACYTAKHEGCAGIVGWLRGQSEITTVIV